MSLVVLNDLSNETRSCVTQIEEWYLPKDAVKTALKDTVGRPYYIWSSNHTAVNATATVASVQIAAEVAALAVPGASRSHHGVFVK